MRTNPSDLVGNDAGVSQIANLDQLALHASGRLQSYSSSIPNGSMELHVNGDNSPSNDARISSEEASVSVDPAAESALTTAADETASTDNSSTIPAAIEDKSTRCKSKPINIEDIGKEKVSCTGGGPGCSAGCQKLAKPRRVVRLKEKAKPVTKFMDAQFDIVKSKSDLELW